MSWFDWLTLGLAFLTPAGGLAAFIYTQLKIIRDNHFAHVNEKLDAIQTSVSRVETKVDDHIQWHLDRD